MVALKEDTKSKDSTSNKDPSLARDDNISVGSKSKKDQKPKEPAKEKRIDALKGSMKPNIMEFIEEECDKIKKGEDVNNIVDRLQKALEAKFPKGWCVYAGSHFFGRIVYEEDHCVEFDIDGYRINVFKTYVPVDKKG